MTGQQTSADHSLDLLTNTIRHDRTVYRWFLFFELQTPEKKLPTPETRHLISQLKKIILYQNFTILESGILLSLIVLSGRQFLAWLLPVNILPAYLLHLQKKALVTTIARQIYFHEKMSRGLTGKTLFHLCEDLSRQQGQPSLAGLISRKNSFAVFLACAYLVLALVVYPLSLNIPQALTGFLITMSLGRLLCDSRWFFNVSRPGSLIRNNT